MFGREPQLFANCRVPKLAVNGQHGKVIGRGRAGAGTNVTNVRTVYRHVFGGIPRSNHREADGRAGRRCRRNLESHCLGEVGDRLFVLAQLLVRHAPAPVGIAAMGVQPEGL